MSRMTMSEASFSDAMEAMRCASSSVALRRCPPRSYAASLAWREAVEAFAAHDRPDRRRDAPGHRPALADRPADAARGDGHGRHLDGHGRAPGRRVPRPLDDGDRRHLADAVGVVPAAERRPLVAAEDEEELTEAAQRLERVDGVGDA